MRTTYVAKDFHSSHRRALELAAMPTACRSGAWYFSVARLLDLGIPSDRATLHYETAEAALVDGLKQPPDVDVLVRVAQVEALGRAVMLPSDACAKAQRVVAALPDSDGARYVCARMAIRDGDGAAASDALDKILEPTEFPDLELARAQAARLLKDRASMIRHARSAIGTAKKLGMRTTEVDRDAIIRLAEELARTP